MADYSLTMPTGCYPYAARIMGVECIIAKDVLPAKVNAPLKTFANAISGSFSHAGAPCSILASWGSYKREEACHAHIGKPETVIYRGADGKVGVKRVLGAEALPLVQWAIGGMGLLDSYDPEAEGFSGRYADVLRKTAHTIIGVAGDVFVLGYVADATGAEVNALCSKMGLDCAIMLDGGHVAAINSVTAKINVETTQHSIIQGV